MSTTLEFVDYIFDRYAYLGLPIDASADQISAEIRSRRAAVHPDKLLRVSSSILEAAEHERALIDMCSLMLSNPGMRALYNDKLLAFKTNDPHLVSTNGVARIDPSRFKIDLDSLLSNASENIDAIESKARELSGMDEKRITKARKRFLTEPNDVDARESLRDELGRKLVFLSAIEDFYWQVAGVSGIDGLSGHSNVAQAQSGSHFTEKLSERLLSVRSMAAIEVEQRDGMVRFGLAPRLLIAGPNSIETNNTSQEELSTAVLTMRSIYAFDARSGPLRDAVEQKARVIDELAGLCRWAHLNKKRATIFLDILMIQSEADYDGAWPGADFTPTGFIFRIERATNNASPVLETPTADQINDWPNELVALEPHSEMPGLFIEAIALANKLAY